MLEYSDMFDCTTASEEPNVYIRTKNANGQLLCGSKTVLAHESTYFYNLFYFSGVNSKAKAEERKEFYIDVEYGALLMILAMTHQTDTDVFQSEPKRSLERIEMVYDAAVTLQIPRVRWMCLHHLFKRLEKPDPDEEAGLAMTTLVRLGLVHIFLARFRMYSLFARDDKKSSNNLINFLRQFPENSGPIVPIKPCLSKADVPWLHDRFFPDTPFRHHRPPRRVIRLEDVAVIPKNLKFDITQKWPGSDVRFRTWNSNGLLLYSNMETLASMSPYFGEMFFGRRRQKGNIFTLDVEFVTMREILWLIHKVTPNQHFASPVLLYDIHFSTGVDQLNIPCLHATMVALLIGFPQFNTVDSLDVANKMGLNEDSIGNVEIKCGRNEQDFDAWINGRQLAYVRNGKEVDLTSSNTKKMLSLKVFFNTYPI